MQSEQAILDATIRILRRDGYAGLTLDKVAALAESSKATIYGYQVQVTGGSVISAAGASWLQIAALAGADAVALTITPATAN